MKKILISGYYGYDNAGDEAVLQAILFNLKQEAPFIKPVVLSANPEKTAKEYGVEAAHRLRFQEIWKALKQSDGLISGGGSLLQDETGLGSIPYYIGVLRLAQIMGKPTFIYAQGIGPVNRKIFYPLIRSGFLRAKYISVRDRASSLLLTEMKVPSKTVEVVVDPVLALPPISKEKVQQIFRKEKLTQSPVIIAIRFWKSQRHYLDTVAQVADQLIRMGEEVVFLPMHEPMDRTASQYVISKMSEKAKMMEIYDAPSLMGIIGESKCVIGMRLHALIFAAAVGVPGIGISYDPKVDQFLAKLNQTPVGTTDELNPDILFDQIKHVLHHLDENKAEIQKRLPALKEQALQPAKQIAQYFK